MKDRFGEWSSCRGNNEGETLQCRHRVKLDIVAFRSFDHRVRSSKSVVGAEVQRSFLVFQWTCTSRKKMKDDGRTHR
jgi:hypothetical protein